MGKDIGYTCNDCHKKFPVRGYIVKNALATKRPIACPGCGKTNTQRSDKIVEQKQQLPKALPQDRPPSEAQINYIISLGGNARNIKTMKDAGEYIGKLKKERG